MTPDQPGHRGRGPAAASGVLAAAVGLGAGELAAGVVGPSSVPVVAVADTTVALVPEGVARAAVALFGAADKAVLVGGVLVVLGLLAAGLGLLGRRRRGPAVGAVLLLGALGATAAVLRTGGAPVDAVPSVVAAGAGAGALVALLARLPGPPEHPAWATLDRRRFVVAGGVAVGAAVLAGGGGQVLQRRFAVAGARDDLVLPDPADPAPALPEGADLAATVPGLTPLFTATADFYRVDTAIGAPQLDPSTWTLSFSGMVEDPGTVTLAELFDRPDVVERDITLACVSNEVGGGLASTARWLGVPLGAVLRERGVQAASDQLLCRSSDGMTIGTPTRAALDVDGALLAFGMNGRPLPVEHGFPVRMVVPGLYGYVSACKWLTGIEATTFDATDAYWVQRGWAPRGPVRTASRIDTPTDLRGVRAGSVVVAGVAWAPGRGVSRVEVRVDEADWTDAELAPEVTADLWRQWFLPVELTRGRHRLQVRATDSAGDRQPGSEAPPFPDGATGWHTVTVDVG